MKGEMSVRLILAVLSTLLEETAIAAVVLWGLPRIEIYIPLPGLVAIMVGHAVLSVFIYRRGSRALKREPMVGLPSMIGSKARVVRPLTPNGMVRIKSELWEAISIGGAIEIDEDVIVVGQDGLKLIVREGRPPAGGEHNSSQDTA